mmetsp:Transcript_17887/g.41393  ORF Transcript_17887/g.41393 Transcript_17887/m.41393 type:complete len:192 (-) Transcript_17887:156-731(-)
MALLLTVLLLSIGRPCGGFTILRKEISHRARLKPLRLSAATDASIADRYFQLEELEDKETATTEVHLRGDHSVEIGETDGPEPCDYTANWRLEEDGSFRMELLRTFDAGTEEREKTDIGKFKYNVPRVLTGEVTLVGTAVSVEGVMHSIDPELGDRVVGFFNMIDTTDIRTAKFEGTYEAPKQRKAMANND